MTHMKTIKRLLAVLLTAVVCTQVAAQGFRNESFPEGSYSPVTNVNRAGCPRVLKDRSVMFRVNAPQAQQVQIDLCGTKYDMQKGDDGSWTEGLPDWLSAPGADLGGAATATLAAYGLYFALLLAYLDMSRWIQGGEVKEVSKENLLKRAGVSNAVLHEAVKRGLFEIYKKEIIRYGIGGF